MDAYCDWEGMVRRLEADGTFLARVHFPPRSVPHAMRGDRVWGVTYDSLDVPYVVRWRLQRATR